MKKKLFLQSREGVAGVEAEYVLQLAGELDGDEPGKLADGRIFLITAIELLPKPDAAPVVKASLAKPFPIPAGLLEISGDILEFKEQDVLNAELSALSREFRARLADDLRRLGTIEVEWEDGRVLGTSATSVEAGGQARLGLGLIIGNGFELGIDALVELRAVLAIDVDVTVGTAASVKVKRRYGIVCRIGLEAAVTLSIDLDDLNLSLPHLTLPRIDLSALTRIKFAGGSMPPAVAGAFARFIKQNLSVTYTWSVANPVLVVKQDGGDFLFAIAENETYDLSAPPAASDLATLEAVIDVTATSFNVTATGVSLARFKDSGAVRTEAKGELRFGTELVLGPGDIKDFGPLQVAWDNLKIRAATDSIPVGGGSNAEPAGGSVRAIIEVERLVIHPTDDPSAVLALDATIEVNPSGVRILELKLREPYPFVLVAKGAQALLRAAQKILQLLSKIRPRSQGEVEGLKRLLEVLGRIAAAIARAIVLVGKEIATAAIKIAELVVELLKKLADLVPAFDAGQPDAIELDVEVRIGLEPLEIRQVLLTLRDAKSTGPRKLSALGVDLAFPSTGPVGLLLDFVSEPGAYLVLTGPTPELIVDDQGGKRHRIATISTDLWLGRPDGAVTPLRDASPQNGERSTEPLLKLELLQKKESERLLLVLAGVSRGEAIFFRAARDPKTQVLAMKPVDGGGTVAVLESPFVLLPLDEAVFGLSFAVNKDRVLPLLGMGEPGKGAGGGSAPSFLDKLKSSLGQVVTVEKFSTPVLSKVDGKTVVSGTMELKIQAAGVSSPIKLDFSLNESFELTLKNANAGAVFPIKSKRIQQRALGLTWVVEQTDPASLEKDEEIEMFTLAFVEGESVFQLNRAKARMELRFDGLSSDGQGLVFDVSELQVGRGGLDLVATVRDRAVRLNGLDVPFRFAGGRLEIRGGVFVGGAITARGQLPPDLVGEATCTAAFVFGFEHGEIVLKSGKVELDKKGEPIVCHATRFTLTIVNLDLAFVREGGYHFYFLVTGSIRFTPKSGEFEDGLLQHLAGLEISLERAPLTGDARVLLRHVSFQKALNPKKTFDLFNLFTFELRAFGFHPASPKFEGRPPAIDISGQIRFAETGDVIQPKIDFHELWIAPPKKGEALPRIKADGLGVELQLAGSVKIRGAVLAVDPDTQTVEGRQFAPPGYDTYGFLGEGAVDIPGFASLEASLGFLEVEKRERPGDRKKAFFLYLQANKLAVEIPTPVWTFYLREAGFGFGYRYTLAGIREAENAKSAAQLVKVLDDVSRRQGDLSRFTAWLPDPEKDNFTLALRGAFQMFPAEKEYDEKAEKEAVNPLFFDIVAALRSDFTFLLSARGWVGVNYATFLANHSLRELPTLRGFLYISVPRSELLLRGIGDAAGFIGEDWPEVRKGTQLRLALQSVNWTTTLYIRPGLFHYELGWPDQLSVELVKTKNMRVTARGGMIFRAADEGILFGLNIEAEAFLHFEGRSGESIGVAVVAELTARLVARVLAFLAKNFNGSLVYGLVSLDARLTFSVQAWMDVDLGFTSFTIRIGFSFSVQFTAVVELSIVAGDGVGGRVNAYIAVQAFGCTLGVSVGFSFNNAKLDAARARVERFLSLSITSEEPDAPPVFAAKKADAVTDKSATTAEAVHKAPPPAAVTPGTDGLKSTVKRPGGRPIGPTNFWVVLRKAVRAPGGGEPTGAGKDFAYALLVPKEARTVREAGFYATPKRQGADDVNHTIRSSVALAEVQFWKPAADALGNWTAFTNEAASVRTRWEAEISVPEIDKDLRFTLAHFFDECFITDTEWTKVGNIPTRVGTNRREPATLREHRLGRPLSGSRDDRNQQRHQHQMARAAEAIESPFDEHAYQARSTLMTMFLDQFVTLAETGLRPASTEVHVTDLGLVLYGPATEFEKLTEVVKHEEAGQTGNVQVLNPRALWFDRQDPQLANETETVEIDGCKIDWQLTLTDHPDIDPEHFLHEYEVGRSIDALGLAPRDEPFRVKPCSTIGDRHEEKKHCIQLLPPDWQFVDKLDDKDVPELVRRALLPTFGEAESFAAATAWLQQFPDRESVTITYSVTPVDIAGVPGQSRSFAVPVLRPQPPIRPAVGELRMVQKPVAATGAERRNGHPNDLVVYLALKDDAWSDNGPPIEGFSVERIYRIVVDPEELEPAGHYGSDATSSRVRGPGVFGQSQMADERTFEVSRNATVRVDPGEEGVDKAARAFLTEEIVDETELAALPRWARLNGKRLGGAKKDALADPEGFLQFLWSGKSIPANPVRVATRFSLETVVRVTSKDNESIDYVSKRVPLPVSHIVDASNVGGKRHQKDAMIRPEAFEWAVPLDLPPLAARQVRTESGFARFRVPKSDARLGDLLAPNPGDALELERDPLRRILTTVRFDAVPDWVTADPTATKPLPLHGTSIAGYDLHELDLDDLAPLDVETGALAKNPAWKRSRRVARIQHLSPDEAHLVPSGNPDWQGWEAHYPSETKRLESGRANRKEGESKPIRSAWYSDRETTAHFAERRPRLRFLPLPPESEIAELMRGGRPQRVSVSLTGLDLPLPQLRRHSVTVRSNDKTVDLAQRFSETSPFVKVKRFTRRDLLDLLQGLAWDPPEAYINEWKGDKQAFQGLQLIIEASAEVDGEFVSSAPLVINLDLQAPDEDDPNRPRRRLFSAIDAATLDQLQASDPTRVIIRLFAPDGSNARATDKRVRPPDIPDADKEQIGKRIPIRYDRLELAVLGHAFGDVQEFVKKSKAPFTRSDVRDLLRALEWDAFEEDDPYLAAWGANRAALEGLRLVVTGNGRTEIPLDTQPDEERADRPRRRWLDAIDEVSIVAIMNAGTPASVKVTLSAAANSNLDTTDDNIRKDTTPADEESRIGLRLPRPRLHHFTIDQRSEAGSDRHIFLNAGNEFTTSDLRHLLLCLGWAPFPEPPAADTPLRKWLDNSGAFDALKLVVEASSDLNGKTVSTGRVEIPLNLRSALHPVLEEALAELALDLRSGDTVYRRFNVLPQPVTSIAAKDLAGFMAATAQETDPYGWQVLQLLGEAVTVRIHDRAEERFLTPSELADRVNDVLAHSVLPRWHRAHGKDTGRYVGQPFAEFFLKPGANRVAGPFDAVLRGSHENESASIDLDDGGLAFMQLSLRPRPAAVWRYMRQEIRWKADKIKTHAISLELTAKTIAVEAACASGGPIVAIPAKATERLSIPASELGTTLTLFFRVPAGGTSIDHRPDFKVTRDGDAVALGDVAEPLGNWNEVPEPATEDLDPFARFEAVTAELWTTAFQSDKSAASNAFQALRDLMRASGGEGFGFPAPEQYGTVVGAYLTWIQRLLEHGAMRDEKDGAVKTPYLALAAPAKAAPWKLAADSEGTITLTFLHSDRWAHARAYAVRPLSRYHDLFSGLGVARQQRAAEFHDDMPELDEKSEGREIGYAVAVSPRTERIEPPVILQSRLAGVEGSKRFVNEIVVARHGEESLAISNRPLLARLGMPASLIAFVRDYRMPDWPKRLHGALEKPDQAPQEPVTLQPRKAEMPSRPEDGDPAEVTAKVVARIAREVPSLWKGADILRVDPLPPHYRLTAFATERAGIVVSEVVTLIADEQPREPLTNVGPTVLDGTATLSLVRAEDGVRLVFEHPLISHKHLTPVSASGWLKDATDNDVAFWPDPDVTYRITRRRLGPGKKIVSVEEDAEVKLVDVKDERPLSVRALGPIYREVPDTAFVKSDATPRTFTLVHALQLHATPPPRRADLSRKSGSETVDEWGRYTTDITDFNTTADPYAAILTPHEAVIDVTPNGGESGAAYVARASQLLQAFLTLKKSWLDGPPVEELRTRVAEIRALLAAADQTLPAAEIRMGAGLPATVKTRWLRGLALHGFTFKEVAEDALDQQRPGIVLTVYDGATREQLDELRKVCKAPVVATGARLERMLRMLSDHLQAARRPDRERLELTEIGDAGGDVTKFNGAAGLFAAILMPHRIRIDAAPADGELGVDYVPRARAVLASLLTVIEKNLETIRERWFDGVLASRIRGEVEARDRFLATADTAKTGAALHKEAALPLTLDTPWLRDFKVAGIDLREIDPDAENAAAPMLVVWDIAADEEVVRVANECPAPVAQAGGRLRRILKHRLLGEASDSIWLTATDVRTRIEFEDGVPVRTPGVAEVRIVTRPWLAELLSKEGDQS